MTDQAETIQAPFSAEQVQVLNRFQHSGRFHGFTCLHHSAHLLTALAYGWRCEIAECDYTQTWAHAFMADEQLVAQLESKQFFG